MTTLKTKHQFLQESPLSLLSSNSVSQVLAQNQQQIYTHFEDIFMKEF